ncbi:MAG: hypothetical protein R3B58_03815 [Phycisphaerales bacterium]
MDNDLQSRIDDTQRRVDESHGGDFIEADADVTTAVFKSIFG